MQNRRRWGLTLLVILCFVVLCWAAAKPFSLASPSSPVFAAGPPSPSATGPASSSTHVAASLALPSQRISRPRQNGVIGYIGDVTTYHYNAARQGFTQYESVLTPSNVNSKQFGLVGFFPVDGKVDGQPLYLYRMPMGPNLRNVLYVVTENDSVYAFDADHGQQLWKASAALPGETPSDDMGCPLITPTIGITATPVIDRQRGAIYFVAMTKDSSGNYHQRLHAMDITNGKELFGGPTEITATYPGTGDNSYNGQVVFDPRLYAERSALLEYGGKIYMAFTSHCDIRPYTGWVMAYDALTLKQTSVLNLTPNGNSGAIWMAGDGLAADSRGNIYLLNGNGTFDTTLDGNGMPSNGDFGNCFLKISTSPKLAVADYFTMFDTVAESDDDLDLGSGGVVVLPDLYDNNGQVHHLAVGAGKDTDIFVVDRDNMGKYDPDRDDIYQEILSAVQYGMYSAPAYYNNTLYFGAANNILRAFTISNVKLPILPTSQTSTSFVYPGTSPSISANLGSNAIVWAVENSNPAVLHAYDANNLATEFYNSNQAGGRDEFGPGNKFITPVIANGKVFVGTQTGVAEFGLLQ
jgi:outer membrane protein assembly factor BamB